MEFLLAYITAPGLDEARRLGRALVSERLAACANILPGMESHYWWNGTLESAQEAVVILKLPASGREALLERTLRLHSAETPCIVFVPLVGGNPAFLDWIADETQA